MLGHFVTCIGFGSRLPITLFSCSIQSPSSVQIVPHLLSCFILFQDLGSAYERIYLVFCQLLNSCTRKSYTVWQNTYKKPLGKLSPYCSDTMYFGHRTQKVWAGFNLKAFSLKTSCLVPRAANQASKQRKQVTILPTMTPVNDCEAL